jgi:hypothetical protein
MNKAYGKNNSSCTCSRATRIIGGNSVDGLIIIADVSPKTLFKWVLVMKGDQMLSVTMGSVH